MREVLYIAMRWRCLVWKLTRAQHVYAGITKYGRLKCFMALVKRQW